ncbi:PHP domain-containing protein [Ectothiorhodospiraceae bacterium WFHF3C12]|nr:PHP domain-containing protein [Ectothiorhodospiraceae bacterium WFHF3C12]
MSRIYDLHSHSTASDGALAPAQLVQRALAHGVTHLALTDHDTVAGIAEARGAASHQGLVLIPGVEISASWSGRHLHIVGLGVEPDQPALNQALEHIQGLRADRARRMDEGLRRRGIEGVLESARGLAGDAPVTRTHFARVLLQRGYGGSMDRVFRHFLRRGKPGYARVEWPAMADAVDWIRGAGGIAVLAHPFGYGLTRAWLRRICEAFVDAGGQGIEVATGTSSANMVSAGAALARRFGLAASWGSDFHDPALPWIELGRMPPIPEDLQPVWTLLPETA